MPADTYATLGRPGLVHARVLVEGGCESKGSGQSVGSAGIHVKRFGWPDMHLPRLDGREYARVATAKTPATASATTAAR